jgi:hypothetical protein
MGNAVSWKAPLYSKGMPSQSSALSPNDESSPSYLAVCRQTESNPTHDQLMTESANHSVNFQFGNWKFDPECAVPDRRFSPASERFSG